MDLSEKIKEGIESWLNKRSRRSMALLSRLSQVPYGSLRRIYQSETRPSPENAIAIAQVIFEDEGELDSFLQSYYPGLYQAFKKISYQHIPNESEFFGFLNSRNHFAVITMAATVTGTRRQIVEKTLGEEGTFALEELLERGFLIEKEGSIFCYQSDFSVPNPRLIINQLKHCLDLYDINQVSEARGGTFHIVTEGLNESALKKASEILQSAEKELFQLVQDERNRGEYAWFGGIFSNVLANNGEDSI